MKVFKNRTTRFLTTSLVCVIFLCVLVFSNMSQQISMHFSTTISLRLDQLDALVATIPPNSSRAPDGLYQELCYQAQARNFDYLGLYSTDGTLEMLYGDQLEITDPGPFLTSLNNLHHLPHGGRRGLYCPGGRSARLLYQRDSLAGGG